MPYNISPYDWDADNGNFSYGRTEPDCVLPYGQGYCNVEPLLEVNFFGKVLTKLDEDENGDFSFWFNPKTGKIKHAIRVKICWDIARFDEETSCSLALHGEYKYKHSPKAPHVSKKRIDNAIEFFKRRKVLFAAVWEGCLDIEYLHAYLCEDLSFEQLLDRFKFEDVHEVDANRTKKRRRRQSNDADKGRIIETGTSKKKRLLSKYNELKTQYPPESHHDEVLLLESVVNDFGFFNMND